MKNLNSFKVVELTSLEKRKVDGGNPVSVFRALVSAILVIHRTSQEGERFYGNNADNPLSGAKL